MFKCGKLAEFVPELNIVFLVGFRRRICAEFNSHLDFFALLNLIRCDSNSEYELGLSLRYQFISFHFIHFKNSVRRGTHQQTAGFQGPLQLKCKYLIETKQLKI